MAAYYRAKVSEFIDANVAEVVGQLHEQYNKDGFAAQYTRASESWRESIPLLQAQLRAVTEHRQEALEWSVLLEYPLYRLRRRIDVVILAESVVVVVELKVGATTFSATDRRQVEEYALDLRDFHSESNSRKIIPLLWSTAAVDLATYPISFPATKYVDPVICIGRSALSTLLLSLRPAAGLDLIAAQKWDSSAYRPVPNVIEAATSIFAGHDVRSIANADAENLKSASLRLVQLIAEAKERRKRYLILLTGVPGSGKTLAGLHVVHHAAGIDHSGDITYLSGNTPLVAVLREALARDEHKRSQTNGVPRTLDQIRGAVRARIQHINDFLKEGFLGDMDTPPHESVIVFDEAQRAWDEKQGQEKFNRTASEPSLLLELMGRRENWCACVCLVGGGQEINSGEEGVWGWGEALRKLDASVRSEWKVVAPPDVINGGISAGKFTLGDLPHEIEVEADSSLQLLVPQRSYRSPAVSTWVNEVLSGNQSGARAAAKHLDKYPIVITRSLETAKAWLRAKARGERRYGLLASSGARRLRADGLGTMLHAAAGAEIAHWYLNEPGDIRSSFALEVPANEYTCQGLELDFGALCWGGDFLWNGTGADWSHKRLSGNRWNSVESRLERGFIENKYRVLLTRAREGMVIWVPEGDDADHTRERGPLDDTAAYLLGCGAQLLGAVEEVDDKLESSSM